VRSMALTPSDRCPSVGDQRHSAVAVGFHAHRVNHLMSISACTSHGREPGVPVVLRLWRQSETLNSRLPRARPPPRRRRLAAALGLRSASDSVRARRVSCWRLWQWRSGLRWNRAQRSHREEASASHSCNLICSLIMHQFSVDEEKFRRCVCLACPGSHVYNGES